MRQRGRDLNFSAGPHGRFRNAMSGAAMEAEPSSAPVPVMDVEVRRLARSTESGSTAVA